MLEITTVPLVRFMLPFYAVSKYQAEKEDKNIMVHVGVEEYLICTISICAVR